MKSNKEKIKVGSLFAGIGGICQGFIDAGAEVVWANEWDKFACITYRANFNHSLYEEDIHKVSPEKLEKIDVLTSGFPCQAFSIAGYQKGFKDSRGNLFFETMRFLEVLKPEAFLFENVKNLVSHDNGNTFRVIQDYIKKAGYSFIPMILNTMEYGNLPQTRERIYMVGFRGESDWKNNPDMTRTRVFQQPKKIELSLSFRDLLETDVVNQRFYYDRFPIFKRLLKEVVREDTVYQWRRIYVRENKKGVCPTLTANMGTGGHNVPLIKDKRGVRKLTPTECLRLQGFKKDFVVPALSDSHIYKQAGNSVSIPVIRRIASEIIKVLKPSLIDDNTAYKSSEFVLQLQERRKRYKAKINIASVKLRKGWKPKIKS